MRPRRSSSAVQVSTHSSVSALGATPISPPTASTKLSQRPMCAASSSAWRRSSERSASGASSATLSLSRAIASVAYRYCPE